ncbi:hypothetical protein CHS0354_016717 [Potamilus streckersoni]|uniref:BTB domain-containing protein n=1 Tax=Potamilus streckersoni TaxID=2493646 RepID=A0AAE0WB41_9BIVA|nr:hypothetical protein CHS0354_016717 [Potamilus streckersoni]
MITIKVIWLDVGTYGIRSDLDEQMDPAKSPQLLCPSESWDFIALLQGGRVNRKLGLFDEMEPEEDPQLNQDSSEEDIEEECEEPPELFQKSELTDITLIVEGKELHFSKYPLMAGSVVFANMIKDSEDKSRLVLDDVPYDDMIMFLECLHPKRLQVTTDKNLEQVANIAHRFKHEGILYRCEEYIVERLSLKWNSKDEIYSNFFFHLKVADKCEMKNAVKAGVLSKRVEKVYFNANSQWGSSEKGYENDKDYIQLSSDTKLQILSRRLKSTELGIRFIPDSALSSKVPSLWR